MSAQHHPSIASRTIGVVLLLWLLLAVVAWNAADTRPKPPPANKIFIELAPHTEIAQPKQPVTIQDKDAPQDLLTAVQTHDAEVILQLITESSQTQLADEHGNTPLHFAVRNGQPWLARLLLTHGADPLQPNNDGLLPVQLIHQGKVQSRRYKPEQRDVLDQLINHQRLAPDDQLTDKVKVQAVFNYAALNGEFDAAKAALRNGAKVVSLGRLKRTLLHLNQTSASVEQYLALGIPINARDKNDQTALSLAIAKGQAAVAERLLEAGADISSLESYSDLGNAIGQTKPTGERLTRLLLENGAIPGQREWMIAISSRNPTAVRQLMHQSDGFDPETTDGAQRIKRAQQLTGTKVLDVMRSDPRIDAYVIARSAANEQGRTQALAKFSSVVAPHLLSLAAIITLLSCFALAPISLVNKGKRWSALIGGLSATLFVHLFLFNRSVDLALAEFRLYGELTPALRIGLMILGDGLAFATGVAVGIAWSVLPRRKLASLGMPMRLGIFALYLACFGVLVAHHQGSIQWPTQVYQKISGYETHLEREAAEAQITKRKRMARYAEQNRNRTQPTSPALFEAIKDNNNEALKDALKTTIADQADINMMDKRGNTAVHKALYPPRPLLLQTLIDAGAALDTPVAQGRQPIHQLVGSYFTEQTVPALELLLDAGVNPNAVDANGMTPLCIALASNKPRMRYLASKMLLSKGAKINPDSNCAPVAVTKANDALRWIVKQGASLNALHQDSFLKDEHGVYQASALWSAAYDGDAQRCQTLISLGADVEQRDTKWGSTPLQAALSGRRRDSAKRLAVAQVLLAAGADTAARAWDGRTVSDFDTGEHLPALVTASKD